MAEIRIKTPSQLYRTSQRPQPLMVKLVQEDQNHIQVNVRSSHQVTLIITQQTATAQNHRHHNLKTDKKTKT